MQRSKVQVLMRVLGLDRAHVFCTSARSRPNGTALLATVFATELYSVRLRLGSTGASRAHVFRDAVWQFGDDFEEDVEWNLRIHRGQVDVAILYVNSAR